VWAVTDLDEMKAVIVNTLRDEQLALNACYELEAYAKLWPFVFMVNEWDVWNESKRALRLQVIRWLEEKGASYDFHQFRTGYGLVGFKDPEAATHFKLRWSGESNVKPVPNRDWDPHPLRSTFEPYCPSEAPMQKRYSKRFA
jgi:hypothetical protein